MELKSKIKKISEPKYGEEIVITKLYADKGAIVEHEKRIKMSLKEKATPEAISKIINGIVIRDNKFDMAMNKIEKCYEFNFEDSDVEIAYSNFQKRFPNIPEDRARKIAHKIVTKELIFNETAKEFSIVVTDDEVNVALDKYNQFTQASIDELINDVNKYENIRRIILDDKITNFIINKFKFKLDLVPPPQKEENVK